MVNLILQSVLEWICFIYVTVTFPIYIFLLVILIVYRKSSELKGAFFTLCISRGICDIISMINNYIGYRFPYWSWGVSFYLNGGPILAKVFICNSWGLRMIQGIGVTLLAVNRATAVLWPFKYVAFWSPRMLSLAVGLQVFMGVIFAGPLAFQDYYWSSEKVNGSLIIAFQDVIFENNYFAAAFFLETIFAFIILTSYIGVFVAFRWKQKKVLPQNVAGSEKNNQELKLAIMCSIVCFFEILWFAFFLYNAINTSLATDIFFLIYDTLGDIYSGINAYLILAFSSGVRDRIKMLLWSGHGSSSVSVMPRRGFTIAPSPRTQSPSTRPFDFHRSSSRTVVIRSNSHY